MSEFTTEQLLVIEGTAAQLYEANAADTNRHPQPWALVDAHIKTRWRNEARRKLKTGQIDGWWKTAGVGKRRDYETAQRHAAEF